MLQVHVASNKILINFVGLFFGLFPKIYILWSQCLCAFLQFPVALAVFGYEAVKLYKEHKKRISTGNTQSICEASIEWTPIHILFCALCGILGGTVGGLLGSGGGFILGPLLLEIGVIPQVRSLLLEKYRPINY